MGWRHTIRNRWVFEAVSSANQAGDLEHPYSQNKNCQHLRLPKVSIVCIYKQVSQHERHCKSVLLGNNCVVSGFDILSESPKDDRGLFVVSTTVSVSVRAVYLTAENTPAA